MVQGSIVQGQPLQPQGLPTKAPPPHVTLLLTQQDSLQMHLPELAVDGQMWTRQEWSTFDQLCNSLVLGAAMPGVTVSPGQVPQVQGLALAYDTKSMDYQVSSVCPPCAWISAEAIALAQAVQAGLVSLAAPVSNLGAGEGKPIPFSRGCWGWHVAKCWVEHILKKQIPYGPMMAWHRMEGWHFFQMTTGETRPRKFLQGLDRVKSNQSTLSAMSYLH